jgi:hypothetical protein
LDVLYIKNKISLIIILISLIPTLIYYFNDTDSDPTRYSHLAYLYEQFVIYFIALVALAYLKFVIYKMKLKLSHPIHLLYNKILVYPLVILLTRILGTYEYIYYVSTPLTLFNLSKQLFHI